MDDTKILVIEDDHNITRFLKVSLETNHYKVLLAEKGIEGISRFLCDNPDLILLDLGLPDIDGTEVLSQIRAQSDVPILVVSARGQEKEKVDALDMGADDYITKPFALAELIARVECVLRRYHKGQEKLLFRDLEIDAVSRVVRRNGENIELTMKELDLLLLFLRNRNITLFRDRIYEEVWEGEYDGESRTVDLHVQRLKKKLGLHTSIISVRKIGYRLED